MRGIETASDYKGVFMNKLRGRLAFDLILTALLVVEMFFQLTGDFLHEVLGIVFFVTIVAHLVLSRKWISVTSRTPTAASAQLRWPRSSDEKQNGTIGTVPNVPFSK